MSRSLGSWPAGAGRWPPLSNPGPFRAPQNRRAAVRGVAARGANSRANYEQQRFSLPRSSLDRPKRSSRTARPAVSNPRISAEQGVPPAVDPGKWGWPCCCVALPARWMQDWFVVSVMTPIRQWCASARISAWWWRARSRERWIVASSTSVRIQSLARPPRGDARRPVGPDPAQRRQR